MDDELIKSALEYHEFPRPGKIEISATKPLATQRDLALAYSPGVAAPCELIAADPANAAKYTARGNLVAVITNGTAVLGLGNIGPLASKPVMEGKGVLFKKFAGVDVFDIEIDESDPDKLVDIIASLEPTFGGINLEDIKSPECFYVERELRKRVKIPVFHDDQHGTAIIATAAIKNALRIVGKDIGSVKLVTSGAGAAAIACLKLLESVGLSRANITLCDRSGVVYVGREGRVDEHKADYARDTAARTLADAVKGADIFLGLSAPGVLTGAMVAEMAEQPIILALANPTPEILPDEVRAVRPDAIIATGRSDFPNQVNNVLCFPYLFRGALDVGATTINEEMKIACVEALAELTLQEPSEVVLAAYAGEDMKFGPDYIIPKPFDPRLVSMLAPAVAKAAMDSGVATRPLKDLEAYRQEMTKYVFQSVLIMKPLYDRAKTDLKRLVYADGEEATILRAVQTVVDDGLARPVLIGRPGIIDRRIEQLGLRLKAETDFDVVNPLSDERFRKYSETYVEIMKRNGVTINDARLLVRTNPTVIASLLVRIGDADAMLCGIHGHFRNHLKHIVEILGKEDDVPAPATMTVLVLRKGTFFICDTNVNDSPSAEIIARMTLLTAERVRRFGMTPKVALLAASNFGSSDSESAVRMKDALALIRSAEPELEIDGEMRADAALVPAIRNAILQDSTLTGEANVLIMPSMDAANIAMNLLTVLGEGVSVGPITLGLKRPAHILTPSSTVRRVVNMSALAVVDAQIETSR
ncbi:MAG: malate dehydrogenase (oxaloacetate-decarboxylating)(NADP+) [Gammaproteobacteria bacterium]|jgi:malate dehydrogenase (oxaloacetate-decarboxylating)(NADP+)